MLFQRYCCKGRRDRENVPFESTSIRTACSIGYSNSGSHQSVIGLIPQSPWII